MKGFLHDRLVGNPRQKQKKSQLSSEILSTLQKILYFSKIIFIYLCFFFVFSSEKGTYWLTKKRLLWVNYQRVCFQGLQSNVAHTFHDIEEKHLAYDNEANTCTQVAVSLTWRWCTFCHFNTDHLSRGDALISWLPIVARWYSQTNTGNRLLTGIDSKNPHRSTPTPTFNSFFFFWVSNKCCSTLVDFIKPQSTSLSKTWELSPKQICIYFKRSQLEKMIWTRGIHRWKRLCEYDPCIFSTQHSRWWTLFLFLFLFF